MLSAAPFPRTSSRLTTITTHRRRSHIANSKVQRRVFASCGQEAFFEGHVHALRTLGGVPRSKVRYDNLKAAVARVLGLSRARVEADRWIAFKSHFAQSPVGSGKPKLPRREPTGLPVCFRPVHPWVQAKHEDAERAEERRPASCGWRPPIFRSVAR